MYANKESQMHTGGIGRMLLMVLLTVVVIIGGALAIIRPNLTGFEPGHETPAQAAPAQR
jgi:hypothetical protein